MRLSPTTPPTDAPPLSRDAAHMRDALAGYKAILLACPTPRQKLMAARKLAERDLFYFIRFVLHREDIEHPWVFARCREWQDANDGIADLWAREHYKDLACDTQMLTANRGWTTHGEIVPGDTVFSPDGRPVKVLAVSERYTDSKCYRVRFGDGAQIVAGATHLWALRHKIKRRKLGGRRIEWCVDIVTTEGMAGMNGRRDVGVAEALWHPNATLPIAPYVLGAWLGDGTSENGTITCAYRDVEIVEQIARCGVTVRERKSSNPNTGLYVMDCGQRGVAGSGMTGLLRRIGLRKNKHIPREYLSASIEQRTELLRGLMDTDGSCDLGGTATFVNKNERLARDVWELATGLGLRPRFREYQAYHGTFWQIVMQSHSDRPLFHLRRKAACAIKPSHHRTTRSVLSVELCETQSTNCLTVDGGLYLAGRELVPTHNSSIGTMGGIPWGLIHDPERTYAILSFKRPIAKGFLRQIKTECETNALLYEMWPHIFWKDPEREARKWSLDDGLEFKRKGNPKEASIEAWGIVEGQPTSRHFSDLDYEDAVTFDTVQTPDSIAKCVDAIRISFNLGTDDGRRRMRDTIWHYHDPALQLIKDGAFRARYYRATVDGKETGEPVLWTREHLAKRIKDLGPYNSSCQLFMDPVQTSMQGFKREWLRFWPADRLTGLNLYILCDPASSKKVGSDYTVFIVIGLGADRNYYVVRIIRDRLGLVERANVLFRLHQEYRPIAVGYEQYGMQADIEHFEDRMKRDNYRFAITPLGGKLSKFDRIGRLVAPFNAGRVFLPEAQPYQQYDGTVVDQVQAFINDEYLAHPFEAHDDMLDDLARILDEELSPMFPSGEPKDPLKLGAKPEAKYNPLRHKIGRR